MGQPDPAQPGPPPHSARPQDRFFNGIRGIGLRRSQHRVLAGVSAGIAERTGIDVTVVRVLTVVLAIFGGLGVLAYGLAWLFLPEPDGRIHAEQVLRGDVSAGAVGAIITSVLSLGSFGGFWNNGPMSIGWHDGGGALGVLWGLSGTALFVGAIAFVIYLVTRGRGATPPPPGAGFSSTPYAGGPAAPYAGGPAAPYGGGYSGETPGAANFGGGGSATMTAPPAASAPAPAPARPVTPRRPTFGGFGALAVGGLALVGAATTALVMSNGSYEASTAVMAWAVALAVLALALVVGGLLGRRAGLVGLFAVIAVIGTLTATIVPKMNHLQGVGERTWRPPSVATAAGGYGLAVGDATLDLSELDHLTLSSADPVHVPASVGIGQLVIQVPTDVTVEIRSSVGAGDVSQVSGFDLRPLSNDNSRLFAGNDHLDNGELSGLGVHRDTIVGGGPVQLYVDAKVGFGQIQIEQVP
jgi:phage shock protein PspC (stress-responsive transcriptional regulator)